eukprot:TRINITY_DN113077_c0_g1_i1.p1 TRINITY_DN113077_c0_g1~~TRINITY_DN113077_c0_g1_i1.p1  ORF type:complete len:486 (+),score=109.03 TRINITY_DN113077_c0_g1_i1:58-1515(+)
MSGMQRLSAVALLSLSASPALAGKLCEDAVHDGKGKCEKSVQWAMNQGVREHPDWYPEGAKTKEDFQCELFVNHAKVSGCQYAPCSKFSSEFEALGGNSVIACVRAARGAMEATTTKAPPSGSHKSVVKVKFGDKTVPVDLDEHSAGSTGSASSASSAASAASAANAAAGAATAAPLVRAASVPAPAAAALSSAAPAATAVLGAAPAATAASSAAPAATAVTAAQQAASGGQFLAPAAGIQKSVVATGAQQAPAVGAAAAATAATAAVNAAANAATAAPAGSTAASAGVAGSVGPTDAPCTCTDGSIGTLHLGDVCMAMGSDCRLEAEAEGSGVVFTLVLVLALVLTLAAVGGIGYFYWTKLKKAPAKKKTTRAANLVFTPVPEDSQVQLEHEASRETTQDDISSRDTSRAETSPLLMSQTMGPRGAATKVDASVAQRDRQLEHAVSRTKISVEEGMRLFDTLDASQDGMVSHEQLISALTTRRA